MSERVEILNPRQFDLAGLSPTARAELQYHDRMDQPFLCVSWPLEHGEAARLEGFEPGEEGEIYAGPLITDAQVRELFKKAARAGYPLMGSPTDDLDSVDIAWGGEDIGEAFLEVYQRVNPDCFRSAGGLGEDANNGIPKGDLTRARTWIGYCTGRYAGGDSGYAKSDKVFAFQFPTAALLHDFLHNHGGISGKRVGPNKALTTVELEDVDFLEHNWGGRLAGGVGESVQALLRAHPMDHPAISALLSENQSKDDKVRQAMRQYWPGTAGPEVKVMLHRAAAIDPTASGSYISWLAGLAHAGLLPTDTEALKAALSKYDRLKRHGAFKERNIMAIKSPDELLKAVSSGLDTHEPNTCRGGKWSYQEPEQHSEQEWEEILDKRWGRINYPEFRWMRGELDWTGFIRELVKQATESNHYGTTIDPRAVSKLQKRSPMELADLLSVLDFNPDGTSDRELHPELIPLGRKADHRRLQSLLAQSHKFGVSFGKPNALKRSWAKRELIDPGERTAGGLGESVQALLRA